MKDLICGTDIHTELNRVKLYYDKKIGYYTVEWERTPEGYIPWMRVLSTTCEETNNESSS